MRSLSSGFPTKSNTNKQACTPTEDGQRLEILDLGSSSEIIGADQLRSNHAADLCLCFRIFTKLSKQAFSRRGSYKNK